MVSAAARKALREAPSKLSQVVQHLEQKPHLRLFGVTSLAVRYDAKRVSPGTRHFVKDALPRLRWANPELAIDVERVFKAEESVKQSIMLTYDTGTTRSFQVNKKWSTTILREIMDTAGGDPWREYKQRQHEEGLPLLPGEDKAARMEAHWKRQSTGTESES
ncbi:hypothetical protein AGABI1DRAFT_110018 [Agaricus bisporus var. burnettii JB137-S8]|uniref:Ribosomal protein/NADH dehydrogenase domain-containing protein n=2 Tax=Agaricus bisporus var. burnettii TaxID=192524 RepID=K5XIM9_AGABU|nr:uncharacterized protein AGABI1DRAFT_110018 [Agaricus bisporus var. burnettii JB137-S8]EKM83348.1 hypothetical protein AGABI1DRAFT_110018 [Agaricus bisporus var. burnettii JB137-S8]KAF7784823.1 hypothetical protein Agabi119p4_988 [Agaricus bisporus var. burnettii]